MRPEQFVSYKVRATKATAAVTDVTYAIVDLTITPLLALFREAIKSVRQSNEIRPRSVGLLLNSLTYIA